MTSEMLKTCSRQLLRNTKAIKSIGNMKRIMGKEASFLATWFLCFYGDCISRFYLGTLIHDALVKIVRTNTDLIRVYLSKAYNKSVSSDTFLSDFKLTNITASHRKKPRFNKFNYKLISSLTKIQIVFEKSMHRQISHYFETIEISM